MKERIKAIRKSKALSQADFGSRLGVSRSVISNLEYGLVEPNDMMIQHICNTFHASEEWLRTGEGEMYEQDAHAILDQLAKEYNLGPAGRMIIQAALKMYDIGGEKAFVDLVRDILPIMQDIVKQADSDMLSHALAAQEAEQAQSGTK